MSKAIIILFLLYGGWSMAQNDAQLSMQHAARKLMNREQYEKAWLVLQKGLMQYPNDSMLLKLSGICAPLKRLNRVGVGTSLDHFRYNNHTWYRGRVEYEGLTKTGPVIGRLNYGYRYGINAYQGELEYYPSLNDQYYAFLGVGMGTAEIFPWLHGAASVVRAFPKGVELELGGRYTRFFSEENIWMGIASLGYYYKNLWSNLRATLVFGNSSTSMTWWFRNRIYGGDGRTYFKIEFLTGSQLGADQSLVTTSVLLNKVRRLTLGGQKRLNRAFDFGLAIHVGSFRVREEQNGLWLAGEGQLNYRF